MTVPLPRPVVWMRTVVTLLSGALVAQQSRRADCPRVALPPVFCILCIEFSVLCSAPYNLPLSPTSVILPWLGRALARDPPIMLKRHPLSAFAKHMTRRVAWSASLVLVAIVFLTYHPGLRMGFYLDDYNYLERAGRTDWSSAAAQIFDPRLQTMWYRPLQAIQFFLEFQAFGGNANAYHLVNTAYHAINVLLLYALTWRISGRWRLGLLSGLFFATFPVYASGVNWIGIVDPLTTVFYLLGIWFWWSYLEKPNWRDYALTLAMFILALLGKQVSLTLPLVLFLVEWWIKRRAVSIPGVVRRYALFAVPALVFAAVQYTTQSTHTFVSVFGWQLGATMAFILAQYLVLFFFPWGVFPSIDMNVVQVGDVLSYTWAAVGIVALAFAAFKTRSRVLLFLGAFALLNLVPVLPFPFIEHRYLYLPILSAATILALVFEQARAIVGGWGRLSVAFSAGLALLAFGSGLAVNASALDAAEWARQLRVPYRDIERTHASYPEDSLLYFIDPITPTTGGLSGMFFVRYGRGVAVRNWTEPAGLREHNASYIYYFDETQRPREIEVEKQIALESTLRTPVDFAGRIRLEGYELARATIQRGSPLVVLLRWVPASRIDRDYTVFIHLVDASGKLAAGYDSAPRKGQLPTTRWNPYVPVHDAIVVPIRPDVPPGDGYKVEIGLYDAQTQERLAIVDPEGKPMADALVFGPVSIVE